MLEFIFKTYVFNIFDNKRLFFHLVCIMLKFRETEMLINFRGKTDTEVILLVYSGYYNIDVFYYTAQCDSR
jgi:hypothetical protein